MFSSRTLLRILGLWDWLEDKLGKARDEFEADAMSGDGVFPDLEAA